MCWYSNNSGRVGANGGNWGVEKAFIQQRIKFTWETVAHVQATWIECPSNQPQPVGSYVRVNLNTSPDYTRGVTLAYGAAAATTQSAPSWTMEIGMPVNWNSNFPNIQRAGYVVAHEFGHVLGFDHENDRGDAPARCAGNHTDWDNGHGTQLTTYDPNSIMNYCGPNRDILSTNDIAGSRLAYGVAASYPNDFNKDSKSDILWYNSSTGGSQIWMMNGTSLIGGVDIDANRDGGQALATATAPWRPAGTNDFNQDGMTDILWYSDPSLGGTGEMQVWFMSANSRIGRAPITNSAGTTLTIGSPWHIVGTNDFDRDGKTDIVWHDDTNGYTQIWYMNGTALRTTANVMYSNGTNVLLGAPWHIVGTNDFTFDGRPDIVWRNDTSGYTQIWTMSGTRGNVWNAAGTNVSYSNSTPVIVAAPWKVVGTGDFNQDGKPEILLRDETDGWTHVWLMNGTTWITGTNVTYNSSTYVVHAPWSVVNH